jgi:hypothetical protein
MLINIFAYTPPGPTPPYVSLNEEAKDKVVLTVRDENGNKPGTDHSRTAQITIPDDELFGLLLSIASYLHKKHGE